MKVYQQIAAVSAELAASGISKGRTNQQQGYAFRGIDDVFNALGPLLAKHGLVILPRILSRTVTERQAKNGGLLFGVVVEAEFDLVAAEDGSRHTVRTYGEAMDSADKATNKAMSAAYKYAALQTFCVPTEGDHDADETTPLPRGRDRVGQPAAPAKPSPVAAAAARTAAHPPDPPQIAKITEAQQARFIAIALEHGWRPKEIQSLLRTVLKVSSKADIPTHRYDEMVELLKGGVDARAANA